MKITDRQIIDLRITARRNQDLPLQHACGLIDGREEPIATAAEYEDRYGGGGHSEHERKQVIGMTEDDAQALVIETIASITEGK